MTKKRILRNQIRIIAGKWRGHKLHFIPTKQLRPTPDRVRETLFNWLGKDVYGARCLDLFAGSGALSFEALSRGASYVVMIDQSLLVTRQLQQHLQRFNINNARIVRGFSPACLKKTDYAAFDIVFLDPPFFQNLIAPCLQLLVTKNYLKRNSLVYVESELNKKDLPISENWVILKHKLAGQVNYYLLAYIAHG